MLSIQPYSHNANKNRSYHPSFENIQRTLIIGKTDAVKKGLVSAAETALEIKGLKVIDVFEGQAAKEVIAKHYGKFENKPFFNSIIDYMTNGPIKAMVYEGENAVKVGRETILSLRKLLVPKGEKQANLFHASDSVAAAKVEIPNMLHGQKYISKKS